MADGWRRLLEEESEHQWLSIGVFFVFVLTGAFAIGATEHFVGASVTVVNAAHDGGLVTEIAYHPDSEAYTALVYAPEAGYHFFTQDIDQSTVTNIYSPDTVDRGAEVRFLKVMPDGEVLYAVQNNQLIGLQGSTMVVYDYPDTNGVFGINDAAERHEGGETHRLLLTQEGANTSLRGVVGMTPTHPMSTSLGVQWNQIEAYDDGLWLAIGTHFSTAGADGSSPASPQSRPVLGWVAWDGSASTPVIAKVQTFDGGVFHSVAFTDDVAVVGGTSQSVVIRGSDSVETLDVPCAAVVSDTQNKVWFIGQPGSNTLSAYGNDRLTTYVLGRPLPVEVSSFGAQNDHVHIHGTDGEGAPIQWSIDITANGSIESGRGFLNLLYLIIGGVVLATMLRYAIIELRRPA
jgi:hypothetical protein